MLQSRCNAWLVYWLTMAYFSKDQTSAIEHIKQNNIKIVKEMGPNNVVIEGTDRQNLFIFNW